jgi:hypothetical protein
MKQVQNFYDEEKTSDLILQGLLKKNTGTFGLSWQSRYAKLYPNRLELYYENKEKDPEVFTMERIESIESKEVKGQKTISIHLINGSEPRIILSPQVKNCLFRYLDVDLCCCFLIKKNNHLVTKNSILNSDCNINIIISNCR